MILSRAKTLEGLLLLRLPPRSFFSVGAPAHIVEEHERLHKVEVASQKRLDAYVRNSSQDVSVPACVTEALAVDPPQIIIKKCEDMTHKVALSRKSDSGAKAISGAKRISATLSIQEHYMNLIETGEKKIEARIDHGDVKKLKRGRGLGVFDYRQSALRSRS